MAFTQITQEDLTNKGVIGLPDTPNLSTTEMQEKFDEIALEVIVPKHNELIGELEDPAAAASIGAVDANGDPSTVQDELNGIKQAGYTKQETDALLANKVDTVPGMGLSQFDFSIGYKAKLDGIEDNANNYVLPKGTQSELGGVMGDGTTFTIDSNGVGHAVGGGGGGTSNYDALINKPQLNGKEVIGVKESEEYGILRPYLLVTSDPGSTITITKGTETVTATQKSGSTTEWEVYPTSYGTWTINSDLPGADTATSTITIDAVKMYSATVNHIYATITVTYPADATYCTCTKGSTVYTATSNPQTFAVRSLGTWTIEVEVDGIVKSATATISADGDTQSVTIEYASIEVTYGNPFRGTTITCTDGTTTYTKTAPASDNTVTFTIPTTGTWTVSGVVSGDTYSSSVVVSAMTSYQAVLNVFSATVTVTFPYSEGATCTLSDGTTTLTAGTSPMAFSVGNTGTWTATATLDGVSKSASAVITTDGQSEALTIQYGEIDLIYDNEFRGLTLTCVNGGTTITKTAPLSGNSMTFYPPVTGTWTISGTYSSKTYTSTATVSSLSTPVSAILQTVPDGSTVTPVNDIQTWLACAGIQKSYTTLAEVLADNTTLLALMSDNNAVDYLVRSTDWASSSSVGLVPAMTDNTHPSGTITYSSQWSGGYDGYKAFSGLDDEYGWLSNEETISQHPWIAYEFISPVIINKVKVKGVGGSSSANFTAKLQAYNGSSWVDLASNIIINFGGTVNDYNVSNSNKYSKYRLYLVSSSSNIWNVGGGIKIQYYAKSGIPDNNTAMTYIGANNYCANTLLANSTWCSAICNSTYIESVLNVKVPTMTSDTAPSGVCSASTSYGSGYAPWKAFDGDNSSYWDANNNSNQWLAYKFTSPQTIYLVKFGTYSTSPKTCKIQANVSGNWTEAKSFTEVNGYHSSEYLLDTILTSDEWRFFFSDAYGAYPGITYLQFYGRQDV